MYQFVSPRIKFPTKPLSFCRALGALHGRHSVSSSLSPPLLNVRKRLTTLRHSLFFAFVSSLGHRQRLRTSAIYHPTAVLRPVSRLQPRSDQPGLKLLHPDGDTVNGLTFRGKKPLHQNCESHCLQVWQGFQGFTVSLVNTMHSDQQHIRATTTYSITK